MVMHNNDNNKNCNLLPNTLLFLGWFDLLDAQPLQCYLIIIGGYIKHKIYTIYLIYYYYYKIISRVTKREEKSVVALRNGYI